MKSKTTLAIAALLLVAGCTSSAQEKPIGDYPEAHAHLECLRSRAAMLANSEGSPLELGIIAAEGCKSKRLALARAMSNRRAFVDRFMAEGRRSDPALAAEMITHFRKR